MSGGPQGSRTPDLRRAKALELATGSHRASQEVIDLQVNGEDAAPGPYESQGRRKLTNALVKCS